MKNQEELIPLEHPGTFLQEEFMKPLSLSTARLARDISVTPARIREIIKGKRGISANTGLRLAKYFGVSEEYFIRLQAHYDMDKAKELIGKDIQNIKTISLLAS